MVDQEPFLAKLMILSEQLWEGRVDRRDIERWLSNFTGEVTESHVERAHALMLLSHVMYFAERELRELLRALFRESLPISSRPANPQPHGRQPRHGWNTS